MIEDDQIILNNSPGEELVIHLDFYPPDFVYITQGDDTIEVHDLVDFILRLQEAETEGTRRTLGGKRANSS